MDEGDLGIKHQDDLCKLLALWGSGTGTSDGKASGFDPQCSLPNS